MFFVWPSQPGKVANPARGQQLNRENGLCAVLSRVSLLISTLQAESSALLTGFLPSSAAASIHYRCTLCTMNAAVHICIALYTTGM